MARLHITVDTPDGRRLDDLTCADDPVSQALAGTYLRHLLLNDAEARRFADAYYAEWGTHDGWEEAWAAHLDQPDVSAGQGGA